MTGTGDVPVRADYLDEAHIAELLAQRQAAYAEVPEDSVEARRDILIWTVGQERYGTPLADVRVVAPVPRVTRIPGAPPQLLGIVGLKGVIHNLFDAAPLVGAPIRAAAAEHRMLVLRHDAPCIALRVATLEGVVALTADQEAGDALTRFVDAADGQGFALVSTPLLIERLLARRSMREG
jgi:purine-binding chemotaxis protein CheW